MTSEDDDSVNKDGSEVAEIDSEAGTVFCRECGSTISEKAEICPECGVRQKPPGGGANTGFDDKQPGIAAVASLVIPGAGQIYLGELNRGILFIVATAVAGILSMFLIGIPFLIGIWIYAIYDAYNLAQGQEPGVNE